MNAKDVIKQLYKARFKSLTSHVLNLKQMRKIYCFRSFALDLEHVKFDIWTGLKPNLLTELCTFEIL